MLYFSLLLSAIFLFTANLAVYRDRYPTLSAGASGIGIVVVFPLACMTTVPVIVQALALGILVLIWWNCHLPARRFLPLGLVVSAAPYVWFLFLAPDGPRRYARLREKFPFESLEERVPLLPAKPDRVDAANPRLDALEKRLDPEAMSNSRSIGLRYLHEQKVRQFVDSPGFGIGRMVRSSERYYTQDLRNELSPTQPADADPSSLSATGSRPSFPDPGSMTDLHSNGLLDFLHPKGFGYVKDRRHVAGFQSHGFSEVPESSTNWKVDRLELVSILLHKDPVMYVSSRLPQMAELKGVPTRSLDPFEVGGLAALRNGEDLHVQENRMMGAVRSTKQCLECHGGNRGDLLGAFSYTLRLAGDNIRSGLAPP